MIKVSKFSFPSREEIILLGNYAADRQREWYRILESGSVFYMPQAQLSMWDCDYSLLQSQVRYTQGDIDVISCSIYASWFPPPSCWYNS